jgi:hypothetical protein
VTCSAPFDELLTPIVICSPGVTVPRFSTISGPPVDALGLAAVDGEAVLLEFTGVDGAAALRFRTMAGGAALDGRGSVVL